MKKNVMKGINTIASLLLMPVTIIVSEVTHAQGEANNWYFGYNAGISFAGGNPTPLTNGAMSTDEGCATISDAAGNLLFYTDGITIYNRNHVVMQNGTGLLGSPSSTQSGVIIQRPGSTTNYYVFTTAELGSADGLRYTEIDMTGDGGNGTVTSNKNVLLHAPTCEKITGVRHANNQDVWLISHDLNSSQFRTYLITAAGINTTPVLSTAGEFIDYDASGSFESPGQLKAYLGGKKIASATYITGMFELFDFDNNTGVISNAILLPGLGGAAYGVEFSPDGSKLYGTIASGSFPGAPPTPNLYQWNLCAGTGSPADIINSLQVVFSGVPMDQGLGSMQLGPDGKIYVARYNGRLAGDPNNSHYLGVIHNPNDLGTACNYVDEGYDIGTQTSALGLPNFVPYNLNTTPPPILNFIYDSILCLNNGVANPVFHPQFAAGGTFTCTDPNLAINATSGAIDLNASQVGLYNVKYEFVLSSCGIQSYDTTVQVNIEDGNQVAAFDIIPSTCQAGANVQPTRDTAACTNGYYGATPPGLVMNTASGMIDVAASQQGNYTISYTCPAIGCKTEAITYRNFEITAAPQAQFLPDQDTVLTVYANEIQFINTSQNANSYSWDFGDGTISTDLNPNHAFALDMTSTRVSLIASQNGTCPDTAYITVLMNPEELVYVPNAFTPNQDKHNQLFKPVITSGIDKNSYQLMIFDRWGEVIFKSGDTEAGWDGTYKNAEVQEGTYIWKIHFNNYENKAIELIGHVSLMK